MQIRLGGSNPSNSAKSIKHLVYTLGAFYYICFKRQIIMYHIDRHPTKELRKKKGIKGDNPVEYLYDVRPAYTGIGFELYWTDDIEFAYEIETFNEVKELLEIAKNDQDYKYAYFLKQDKTEQQNL